MGKTLNLKILLVAVILGSTGLLVHMTSSGTTPIQAHTPLEEALGEIDGYDRISLIELADDAFAMLKLDDYFFADFKGPGGEEVNLYIGYYYSANKAYAAHSPLICYPSQGWQIDVKPRLGRLEIDPHTIKYEEIVTSLGGTKELVLYWYQTRLFTNVHVYRNKIDMGYNKLKYNDQQHGFVRVSVPVLKEDFAAARAVAYDFIKAFYPQLTEFVTAKEKQTKEI